MASHYEAPIRNPLIVGDKTYHDVTVDVARPVEGKANRLWWIVFSVALAAFLWGLGCIVYTVSTGIGGMGIEQDRWLGLGYHQLCMVGRYRSRRYTDLRRIVTLPPKMENGYQPLRGGYDHLLRSTSGALPYHHMGRLASLLDSTYS